MASKQSLANKIHYETLAEAWRSGRESPSEASEWSVLTAEPGGVDYIETNLGDKTALWVQPKTAAKDRVMLYLHGGGYVGGSIWTHRKMVGHLAKAIGCYALIATYDYAFQSKFPRQIEQAVTAFEWLAEQGFGPKHTISAGDSAGAGLVVAAALKLRDAGRPLPAAILSISGWHDLSASGHSYETNREKDAFFQRAAVEMLASQVLGGADPRASTCKPDLCRSQGPAADLSASGRGRDPARRQPGARRTRKGRRRRVRFDAFPGMLHSFQMMAGRAPEADGAIERFAQWVRPQARSNAAAATRGIGSGGRMTRKLRVGSFVSLDGVIENPTRIAGSHFDQEVKEYSFEALAGVEFFLLGRVAYEMFASRPETIGDKYADRLNGMKKLVASRTLEKVAWNASLIKGDVAAELAKIKQQPGGNIVKYGITNLDRTLLAAGLVDEYQIWVIPKVVGEGKRVFEEVDKELVRLKLVDTHRFKNGVMVLSYVP